MRSPNQRSWVALSVVALVVFAPSCSTSGHDDADEVHPVATLTPPTSLNEPVTGAAPDQPTANDTSGSAATDTDGTSPTTDSSARAAGSVVVSGGPLPSVLVEGYATNGGDLVDPAEWHRRFGDTPLPTLEGDGVMLAEALRRFDRRDAGWVRTDEASWLTMSTDDRDTTIAALADATGVAGQPHRAETTEQGADCVLATYPTVDDVAWQVQGCSYREFPRLLALGVTRTAPTDTAPTSIDPSVTALADTLDGQVTFAEVRLNAPGADGATLHLSAQLTTATDNDSASVAVAGGPLSGWQSFPGEDSTLLSGPTGATWTLSNGVAVFDWAGRW